MEEEAASTKFGGAGADLGKCKVCRAKALDMFFGIPSCKVCRGIFKRGLKKKFECVSEAEGSCDVKETSPNQCKACIFAKCARKGMVAKESNGQASAVKPKVKKQDKSKKPEKKPKVAKKSGKSTTETRSTVAAPAKPARFYQVETDLKSLFHHDESIKPFSFFDGTTAEGEDEFSLPKNFGATKSASHHNGYYDEEAEERDVVDQSTINRPSPSAPFQSTPQRKDTFFFTENDPRIEEGLRCFSMTKDELAESIEIWKRIRPQLAADFKKIKKQANRKRKTFER